MAWPHVAPVRARLSLAAGTGTSGQRHQALAPPVVRPQAARDAL